MTSWINIPSDSDFTIYNIPFGIYAEADGRKKPGARIGNSVIDLKGLNDLGIFTSTGIDPSVFDAENLNPFIGQGKVKTNAVRQRIQQELSNDDSVLKNNPAVFVPADKVTMHMPVAVTDYTDFYSSIDHATNVGKMFRDPENALLPNWRHLPVGYHGRASSIIPSGIPIHRPKGQTKPKDGPPVFGPCRLLDFELEMAFIVGRSSDLGQAISTKEAPDYIFGMVLFNDWSARDIQKWEYVPLGPFLGKSFGSSISPWIVTMEALAPFKVRGQQQEPAVLPYLQFSGNHHYDINLSVGLTPENGSEQIICNSNYKHMYWNMVQQLAHHTVNGCNLNIGDMMASGTISGPEEGSYGSMLELSWGGTKEVKLNDGSTRKFLADLDTVTMYGHAEEKGKRVGFGSVTTQILPSL